MDLAVGRRVWLMKTEPHVFSIDDLLRAPDRTSSWEGVRNFQARNFMRDGMRLGDFVLIYHSSCERPGIVGLAEVVREAHPDLTALDPESPYFDSKSKADGLSRWCMVDVRGIDKLKNPLYLDELRAMPALSGMVLLQKGSRLSVQPVSDEHWQILKQQLNS